ncbi:MAG: hypothetical protein FK733_16495 [Asgard group archaeon]|nr:hypothetical protein [Asgard group archaeon]
MGITEEKKIEILDRIVDAKKATMSWLATVCLVTEDEVREVAEEYSLEIDMEGYIHAPKKEILREVIDEKIEKQDKIDRLEQYSKPTYLEQNLDPEKLYALETEFDLQGYNFQRKSKINVGLLILAIILTLAFATSLVVSIYFGYQRNPQYYGISAVVVLFLIAAITDVVMLISERRTDILTLNKNGIKVRTGKKKITYITWQRMRHINLSDKVITTISKKEGSVSALLTLGKILLYLVLSVVILAIVIGGGRSRIPTFYYRRRQNIRYFERENRERPSRADVRKHRTLIITTKEKTKYVDVIGYDDVEEIYLPEEWDSLTLIFEHFFYKNQREILAEETKTVV